MTLFGKRYLLLPVLMLVLLLPVPAAAQRMAVKTNIPSLALATPDLGFELVTCEHVSLSLSAFGTYNPYWRDLSAGKDVTTSFLVIQPEVRYWFNGRPMTRFYAGVGALAATYDFPYMQVIHKGNAAGAGLSFGYMLSLSKRVNIEFSSGAGMVFYWGKRQAAGGEAFQTEDSLPDTRGCKLMPTRLGVSLVYIFK